MIGRVRCTLTVTLDRGIIDVALKYGRRYFYEESERVPPRGLRRDLRASTSTVSAHGPGKLPGKSRRRARLLFVFLDDLNTRSSPVLQAC